MRDERCSADTLPIQPRICYCIGGKDHVLKSIAMNVKNGGKVSLCSVFRCVTVSPGFLNTNSRGATAGFSIVDILIPPVVAFVHASYYVSAKRPQIRD